MRNLASVALALVCLCTSSPSADAMEPRIAASIFQSLQLAYYRNFTGGTYVFTGYLDAASSPKLQQYQQIKPGHQPGDNRVWPNGQALYKVPNLTLGTCLLTALASVGDMVIVLWNKGGPPYGPDQTTGGCADASGSPPEPAKSGQISSCDNPPGANHFAVAGMNPVAASRILGSGNPGAKCDTQCNSSGIGLPTYPCQAGMLGCASDGTGPLCTPFPG